MKRIISIALTTAFCLAALFCVGSLVYNAVGSVKRLNDVSESDAASDGLTEPEENIALMTEEENSIFFDTVEEYVSYMTANDADGVQNIGNNDEGYYVPAGAPEGAVLENIKLGDEGVAFTYGLELPSEGPAMELLMSLDVENDQYLLMLLQTYRVKVFKNDLEKDPPVIYYTNAVEFAKSLAADVGAQPVKTAVREDGRSLKSPTYLGYVYAYVNENGGYSTKQAVGYQLITVNNEGKPQYEYFPISISLDSILGFEPLEYIANDSNSDVK